MKDLAMTDSARRQPAIFLPHGGGPCFFMDWTWGPPDTWVPTRRFLEALAGSLPETPRAILVISGHWEESSFTVGAATTPQLVFDYYGFPEHTYHLEWPARTDPNLAERVLGLLNEARLPAAVNHSRGYDHGVFVPLKIAFPEAQIPVIPLSLALERDGRLDVERHLAAGRALAPLRDEGVLIVGSGMSFHNLRAYFRPETRDTAREFDLWLTQAVQSSAEHRDSMLRGWASAPHARFAHPREEHLLPLMVVAGAAGHAPGVKVFGDEPMGAAISAYRFDG